MNDRFDINLNRLHDEWEAQPKLYHEAKVNLVERRRDWERAKAAVKVAWSEVELDVRSHPEDHGIEKVTEATIEATVTVSKKYRKAVEVEIQAHHDMGIAEADVETWGQRKNALEDETKLLLNDFFAVPRIKGAEWVRLQRRVMDETFNRRDRQKQPKAKKQ